MWRQITHENYMTSFDPKSPNTLVISANILIPNPKTFCDFQPGYTIGNLTTFDVNNEEWRSCGRNKVVIHTRFLWMINNFCCRDKICKCFLVPAFGQLWAIEPDSSLMVERFVLKISLLEWFTDMWAYAEVIRSRNIWNDTFATFALFSFSLSYP